jgi:hypothetical protein
MSDVSRPRGGHSLLKDAHMCIPNFADKGCFHDFPPLKKKKQFLPLSAGQIGVRTLMQIVT